MDDQISKAGPGPAYRPPQVTYVGHLADLTRQVPFPKEVQAIDGQTYLGADIGS
jgi:hypothetical protein